MEGKKSGDSKDSEKEVIFNMWGIFKKFTTRDLGDEKQERWWIEVRGTPEEYEIVKEMQPEIELAFSCHLEAKSG